MPRPSASALVVVFAVVLALVLAWSSCASQPAGPQTPTSQPSLLERLHRLATRSTIVVAHRGDSGTNPENTIPAFSSALTMGSDMVELDFYQTSDGVLVCFHDRTLDRTTDAVSQWQQEKTCIADHTWKEIATLDAGSWKDKRFSSVTIPTLESALRVIQRKSITMIEHKAGEPRVLIALLRRMGLIEDVLVQSFDWGFLAQVHQLEPRITLAALGGSRSRPHPVGEVLADIQDTGASMVHWSARRLRPGDVRTLHDSGFLVCVYTVDKASDYDAALDLGVDAITTNFPGRLRTHLAAKSGSR